ncbi:MAG: hypothetical protein J6I72_02225 [Muribaculaceae bacterium]|nr:hypothetical protein [Muribaculaceae bacterium]
MKKTLMTIAAGWLLLLGGCAQNQQQTETTGVAEKPWYEDIETLEAQLAEAVADAQKLDSTKIAHDLMPIRKDYPGLEWANFEGHDMVLVATLVDSTRLKRFFGQEGVYPIDRETGTWISIPADWKKQLNKFEGLDSVAAHMRMVQLYGLAPDCDFDIIVLFFADPKGMFRPAHDPDITTTSAGLDFPAYANEKYTVGETNFREWYRYSVASAYEDDSPLPWSQLGYTYDWHEGAQRQGLSEYIVSHHTLIKVKSAQSFWSFLRQVKQQ